jgi:hypothetical protein
MTRRAYEAGSRDRYADRPMPADAGESYADGWYAADRALSDHSHPGDGCACCAAYGLAHNSAPCVVCGHVAPDPS